MIIFSETHLFHNFLLKNLSHQTLQDRTWAYLALKVLQNLVSIYCFNHICTSLRHCCPWSVLLIPTSACPLWIVSVWTIPVTIRSKGFSQIPLFPLTISRHSGIALLWFRVHSLSVVLISHYGLPYVLVQCSIYECHLRLQNILSWGQILLLTCFLSRNATVLSKYSEEKT